MFAAAVATHPVKVSLIGPDRISQRFAWERSQAVYKDIEEFIADVVAIERQMICELIAAGCRYVHMDAPGFTAYVDHFRSTACARAVKIRTRTWNAPSRRRTTSLPASTV